MVKIVLVEDEVLVARMYESSLTYEGFNVVVAMNGKQAVEMIQTEKPDLVLLDIMMPEMSGMEVLEIIKSDAATKGIPIVMLTNLSGKHDVESALAKGAMEYWVKSDLRPRELSDKVKKILKIV
jgi:CheY-like chemotaxis protein